MLSKLLNKNDNHPFVQEKVSLYTMSRRKGKILDHYGLRNKYSLNPLRVDEDSCKDQDLYCLHHQSIYSKCHHFFHLSP